MCRAFLSSGATLIVFTVLMILLLYPEGSRGARQGVFLSRLELIILTKGTPLSPSPHSSYTNSDEGKTCLCCRELEQYTNLLTLFFCSVLCSALVDQIALGRRIREIEPRTVAIFATSALDVRSSETYCIITLTTLHSSSPHQPQWVEISTCLPATFTLYSLYIISEILSYVLYYCKFNENIS
jgi:hypothetical protein